MGVAGRAGGADGKRCPGNPHRTDDSRPPEPKTSPAGAGALDPVVQLRSPGHPTPYAPHTLNALRRRPPMSMRRRAPRRRVILAPEKGWASRFSVLPSPGMVRPEFYASAVADCRPVAVPPGRRLGEYTHGHTPEEAPGKRRARRRRCRVTVDLPHGSVAYFSAGEELTGRQIPVNVGNTACQNFPEPAL